MKTSTDVKCIAVIQWPYRLYLCLKFIGTENDETPSEFVRRKIRSKLLTTDIEKDVSCFQFSPRD